MTKAKFEFDLNDPDDRREFEIHTKAMDFYSAFYDISNLIRNERKYPTFDDSEKKDIFLENISECLHPFWDLD